MIGVTRLRPRSRISAAVWNPSRPGIRMSSRMRAKSCRSEEHTSELQSQSNLVCRLLLENKKDRYLSSGFYPCMTSHTLPPVSALKRQVTFVAFLGDHRLDVLTAAEFWFDHQLAAWYRPV